MENAKMTEKDYKEMVYRKAKEVETKEQLVEFIDYVTDFKHDYGTVIYGCCAVMKAAFRVVNSSPKSGGITGFQAGCIGLEMIQEFMMIKPPFKVVDLNNLLFPQYRSKFEKTIDQETWGYLQKQAKENLESEERGAFAVRKHWKSIVDGVVPFGFTIKEQD